ncbi:MAG: DMT family transporter [Gammaproteobacteria bacterium]|nr:DMT family transporter [Gammaproteobacteria bacterium]
MGTDTSTRSVLFGMGIALLGFAVFSLHDALIKSVRDIPVFQTVFLVVLFSFVPFTLMLAVDKRERSLRPNRPAWVGLRCLFTTGSLVSVFYAFTHLPLAEAYSLIFSAPILITLLAIPVLGEKIRLIRWVAIVVGLLGVVIVLKPGQSSFQLGHLAGLAAALCTACTSVVTRKIGAGEHPTTLILYPMLTNVIISGLATVFVYVPIPGDTLLKLAAVGCLSVIGQMLMISAYRNTEAQFIAPMQYSQMLWALIYGALVFQEKVDQTVLAGAAIIVLSGLLFIWRELVASITKPVLRTRNVRASGGPQATPVESDHG